MTTHRFVGGRRRPLTLPEIKVPHSLRFPADKLRITTASVVYEKPSEFPRALSVCLSNSRQRRIRMNRRTPAALKTALRTSYTTAGIKIPESQMRFRELFIREAMDYIIPPMPPPGIAGIAGASDFFSANTHSVVRNIEAIEAAFSNATRETLVGSMIPALSRSS